MAAKRDTRTYTTHIVAKTQVYVPFPLYRTSVLTTSKTRAREASQIANECSSAKELPPSPQRQRRSNAFGRPNQRRDAAWDPHEPVGVAEIARTDLHGHEDDRRAAVNTAGSGLYNEGHTLYSLLVSAIAEWTGLSAGRLTC